MSEIWDHTKIRLCKIQESDQLQGNKHRGAHDVRVDGWVLLDTKNLALPQVPQKLRPRFCGPFKVLTEVTPVTFRLELPPS